MLKLQTLTRWGLLLKLQWAISISKQHIVMGHYVKRSNPKKKWSPLTYLSNLTTFMVASNQSYSIRIPHLHKDLVISRQVLRFSQLSLISEPLGHYAGYDTLWDYREIYFKEESWKQRTFVLHRCDVSLGTVRVAWEKLRKKGRVMYLKSEQQQKSLNRVKSSVDKVPQKQIVCLRAVASHFEKLLQIIELAMYITANLW